MLLSMDRPGTRPRQIPGTFWRTRPRPRPRSNIPNGRVFGRVPKNVNKPKKLVKMPKSGANDHGLIFYSSLNHSIGIGMESTLKNSHIGDIILPLFKGTGFKANDDDAIDLSNQSEPTILTTIKYK